MMNTSITVVIATSAFALASVGCVAGDRHLAQTPPHSASKPQPIDRGFFDDDNNAAENIGSTTTPPVRRAPPQFDDADASAIPLFHDVLAAYGSWTDDPRLGLVWIPSRDAIGESFVPYATHGRWTHRELAIRTATGSSAPFDEWVWVSDVPWGWVTFHYGRWAYTGDRGWAWIAGRRYSGAWVDWRSPSTISTKGGSESIIGWGPTPPAHVWRISPGMRVIATPYSAFATPYTYAKTRDLFVHDLGTKLFNAATALSVAFTTEPSNAPSPVRALGFRQDDVPAPPAMDRGLQQAWMLATPATASAVGHGPELGPPPHLRTWVVGGPRYTVMR